MYDVATKSWNETFNGKKLPRLHQKRKEHACLFDKVTSSVYVMGGSFGNNGFDSTEKWTLGTDSWVPLPSAKLPEPLKGSRAVSAYSNEYVGYIAGGFIGKDLTKPGYITNEIWGLKRSNMTWIKLTKKLSIDRAYHSLLNIPVDEVLGC